jgi:hypothetical protein
MKPRQKETASNEVADFSKYTSHIQVPCFQPKATIDNASVLRDDDELAQTRTTSRNKGGERA